MSPVPYIFLSVFCIIACVPPLEVSVTSVSTATGYSMFILLFSPSCPFPFSPHVHSNPFDSNAVTFPFPADILIMFSISCFLGSVFLFYVFTFPLASNAI